MGTNVRKYRYNGKNHFDISTFDTRDKGEFESREEAVDEFVDNLRAINQMQQKLYAARREGVIFIFQAMDAAGKDGVIRTVFSTLTPHGVKEFCFKVPSSEESSHDYLWRFWSALPARGHISIFNRSYYEDVLVGKVKSLYKNQLFPERLQDADIISMRYDQINDFEKYLYQTGTRVVKIFLNVSKDEQARRFVSRIDVPKKNWKLSVGDITERRYWDQYMDAFETMVNVTSTQKSPWYVVPADHKWYARLVVSRIVRKTLEDIDPQYPTIEGGEFAEAAAYRQELLDSITDGIEDIESGQGPTFSNPSVVAAGICADDELKKASRKKQELKDEGFKAIRALIARGYILKDPTTLMEDVIAQTEDDDDDADFDAEACACAFADGLALDDDLACDDEPACACECACEAEACADAEAREIPAAE